MSRGNDTISAASSSSVNTQESPRFSSWFATSPRVRADPCDPARSSTSAATPNFRVNSSTAAAPQIPSRESVLRACVVLRSELAWITVESGMRERIAALASVIRRGSGDRLRMSAHHAQPSVTIRAWPHHNGHSSQRRADSDCCPSVHSNHHGAAFAAWKRRAHYGCALARRILIGSHVDEE